MDLDALDTRNWACDEVHESGKYQCKCRECGRIFIGHKARVWCRFCAFPELSALIARVREAEAERDELRAKITAHLHE